MDYELTRKVLSAFEREEVRYVVFGAVALNLPGLARATQDLDVFIAPERDNIEKLKSALRSVFDDPHIDETVAEDLLGEYPAVQYVPPEGSFHLDILTRLGEAFAFADIESERVDFGGLTVSITTPRMLYRMKKGTVRPKDRGDADSAAASLQARGAVMGVKKFRSVEQMEDTLWHEPGHPALFKAIEAVWDFAERTVGARFPPGVYRHRSIEVAERLREQWDEANFRSYQKRVRPQAQSLADRERG